MRRTRVIQINRFVHLTVSAVGIVPLNRPLRRTDFARESISPASTSVAPVCGGRQRPGHGVSPVRFGLLDCVPGRCLSGRSSSAVSWRGQQWMSLSAFWPRVAQRPGERVGAPGSSYSVASPAIALSASARSIFHEFANPIIVTALADSVAGFWHPRVSQFSPGSNNHRRTKGSDPPGRVGRSIKLETPLWPSARDLGERVTIYPATSQRWFCLRLKQAHRP